MTDGEIVREYNQAKNKKTETEVLSDLTLKPKEEIIRILKENGCEVKESRKGRKPKEEETDGNAIKPVRRRRKTKSSSEVPGGGSSDRTTNGSRGVTDGSSSDKAINGSSGVPGGSSSDRITNGSSGIPHCVWNAVRERYKYLGYSIEQLKKQIEEQSKELAELMEFIDQNGILEKDLVR